jgi:hypothetical protein
MSFLETRPDLWVSEEGRRFNEALVIGTQAADRAFSKLFRSQRGIAHSPGNAS